VDARHRRPVYALRKADRCGDALQVSQFVGGERPVPALRGDPQPDMAGLNRRYHEIADARKIARGPGSQRGPSFFRGRRRLRLDDRAPLSREACPKKLQTQTERKRRRSA
jgi:hypothetical protein